MDPPCDGHLSSQCYRSLWRDVRCDSAFSDKIFVRCLEVYVVKRCLLTGVLFSTQFKEKPKFA